MPHIYHVLGLMSGTSLDGLDIAYCRFEQNADAKTKFEILATQTIAYTEDFKKKFVDAEKYSTLDFIQFDREIGFFFGLQVSKFLTNFKLPKPDFVASHGHTIFHDPAKKYTVQIGHGASIAAASNLPVVCDFRSLDVALGGQGAPLVPIGDELLFEPYSHCLNLGGIANISYQKSNHRIAFDICPCNIPLNFYAKYLGLAFDKNGEKARSGSIDYILLQKLNDLDYYKQLAPKSLGKEWVDACFMPLLARYNLAVQDVLATLVEHISIQISKQIDYKSVQLLITGGGAFNTFLIEKIKSKTQAMVIIPDENIVKFKEAIIFALLGLLRWQNQSNTLKTVTGASKDSIGGCIYSN